MREYRVTWKREGQRPKLRLYQTEAAARRHMLIVQGRIAEAFPEKRPDDRACCEGRECGCRGLTNAQAWAEQSARVPPLTEGPFIESREVGEWEPVSEVAG